MPRKAIAPEERRAHKAEYMRKYRAQHKDQFRGYRQAAIRRAAEKLLTEMLQQREAADGGSGGMD